MKQVLTLLPDTFLWLKASAGLLYNAKTFEKDGFNCTPSLKSFLPETPNKPIVENIS